MPSDTQESTDLLKRRFSVDESYNNNQTDSEYDSDNIFDNEIISDLEENDSDEGSSQFEIP